MQCQNPVRRGKLLRGEGGPFRYRHDESRSPQDILVVDQGLPHVVVEGPPWRSEGEARPRLRFHPGPPFVVHTAWPLSLLDNGSGPRTYPYRPYSMHARQYASRFSFGVPSRKLSEEPMMKPPPGFAISIASRTVRSTSSGVPCLST